MQTTPRVFLVAETRAVEEGMLEFLRELGVDQWSTDAPSDAERIAEIMGRLCYLSFGTELNPNVTKVREGNSAYLKGVIGHLHGSVLEHSTATFILTGVSRVVTHELVRHRPLAISQTSLRYVRLKEIRKWLPSSITENDAATSMVEEVFSYLEEMQGVLGDALDVENLGFEDKKKVTSAMRRIAPIGLATNIGVTGNMRAWRWIIEARTNPHAEEEMRLVVGMIAKILTDRYPNMFYDFEVETVGGLPWYKPVNSKV